MCKNSQNTKSLPYPIILYYTAPHFPQLLPPPLKTCRISASISPRSPSAQAVAHKNERLSLLKTDNSNFTFLRVFVASSENAAAPLTTKKRAGMILSSAGRLAAAARATRSPCGGRSLCSGLGRAGRSPACAAPGISAANPTRRRRRASAPVWEGPGGSAAAVLGACAIGFVCDRGQTKPFFAFGDKPHLCLRPAG